jgi:hypothetical protein
VRAGTLGAKKEERPGLEGSEGCAQTQSSKQVSAHAPEHEDEFRPDPAPNRPAGHATHSTAPPALKRPGEHGGSDASSPAPAAQAKPAGHGTWVALVELAGQWKPAAQPPLHCTDDTRGVLPKRPAGHGAHTAAPAEPKVPAGQGMAVPEELPVGHM